MKKLEETSEQCSYETKAARSIQMWSRRTSLDNDAVPLWVGLVVFVSLVFNHSVAADANVWPGHLHPVQSDPATHTETIHVRERKTSKHKEGEMKERQHNERKITTN